MSGSRAYVLGHYERLYHRVAEGIFDSGEEGDGFIHVDAPGLEGFFAFPTGGLTVIIGRSGAGKSILCDNLFGWAGVPTAYFPLQSVSLVAAHTRMCAMGAGFDYWGVVAGRRSMPIRIGLGDASELIISHGKVLVCLDEMTPSLFNEALMDVIGESEENPGSIDERASNRLVLLDNVGMLAANGNPLEERIRFCKDMPKGSSTALVAVVAGDYGDTSSELANADEIYSIKPTLSRVQRPMGQATAMVRPEKTMRVLIRNEKTSRFDGHPTEAELEIDLSTREIRRIEG